MNMVTFPGRAREALGSIRALPGQIRWGYLGVAFVLALGLWYVLTVRDQVETWVDVRVEYRGLPQGLVVREGLVDKVSVRLRAAQGLTRTIASRPYAVSLDLAPVQKGTTVLYIEPEILPFSDAFTVLEISPSSLPIVADALEVREVPVEAALSGSLARDFYVRSLRATPQAIRLRGAAALVGGLEKVFAPVVLTEEMQPGPLEMRVTAKVPDGVAVEPQHVIVDLDLGVRTKTVRVSRDVRITAGDGITVSARPARVSISVEMPESRAGDRQALAGITATAALPEEAVAGDEISLPVHVLLPEHASLNSVQPGDVAVQISGAPSWDSLPAVPDSNHGG